LLLAVLFLIGVGQLHAQTSFVFTNTQSASPIAAFTTVNVITNIPNPAVPAVITSTVAPSTVSGYQFTHWTVGGVRIEDITGRAANPVTIVMSNANVSAIANYVPVTNYTGDTLVPDWFKLEYFGSTATNATSDSDGDGFDLATEFFRGYHPRITNELVEGGVSRRRSETLVVLTSTNYSRVTVVSDPAGITNNFAVVTNTGTVTIPSSVSYSGYTFIGWFVDTNRMDSPQGLSLGNLTFTITNDTTFVAKFVLSTLDSDGDTLLDGYELYNFNTLTNTANSDPDGDGFTIAVENFRSYSPQVFNELLEGGVSRRRSETLVVLTSTNYARVTVQSDPAGITNAFAVVTNTGTITLPSLISYSGYTFIGWFADTNRMDSPQGLSLGNLTFTITNDVTFVAKFVLSTLDSDGDGLLDGYELYNFNTLTNTGNSDPDGDGFTIAVENFRSYSPQVFNELVEGGISRRRSETLAFVPAPPDFSQQPAGSTNLAGNNVTITTVGHGIGALAYQWRLNGVNLDGATNASLTLTNAQFTNAGGFSVVVTSPYGASNSVSAPVVVTDGTPGFNLNMTDAFPGPLFTDLTRTGLASNVSATRQTGEPLHAAKKGTNSVWLTWRAPSTGIVQLSTLGSGFDTLLAVYTGSDVSALTLVASDEDSGGFYTSALKFNATAGTDYRIAVDGLAGSTGHILLSWRLEPTTVEEVPRITAQPAGRTVAVGARVPLNVGVVSSATPSYQWFRNGVAIAGANRSKFTIEKIRLSDAGVYQVAVWIGTRTNFSQPASIQISSNSASNAKDKIREAVKDDDDEHEGQSVRKKDGSQTTGGSATRVAAEFNPTSAPRVATGIVPITIALGVPEVHAFNNYGSRTDPSEFPFAGKVWFATDNLLRTPATNGVLLVESRATGVEVAVAITELLGNSFQSIGQTWFATNSSPGLVRLSVPVKGGTNYYVTWCTSSKSAVHYTNDVALVDGTLKILQQPADAAIAGGGSTTLRVLAAAQGTASGGSSPVPSEDLRYQWSKDGGVIAGATAPTYAATSAGTYSVVVTNVLGSVTSSNAVVTAATAVSISTQPVAASAILGNSVSFSVVAAGSGPLFYQWTRNGVEIPGANDSTHLNDSVEAIDAGSYAVVISNAVNAVTSSVVALTVLVPPSITSQPASVTNAALGTANFSLTVAGTGPLAYQWQFNGANLGGATSATLSLPTVTTNHAGSYRVVVTNVAGSVTSSVAVLTVERLTPLLGWATPATLTYGTALGAGQLNATSNVPGTLAYTPPAGTLLPAGSHVLSAAFTPTDVTVYLGGSLSVTQVVNTAGLTITANNASREYGQANPALTVRYAGFVNGETNTVLTAQPVAATTANAASLPGTYDITVSGASAANYMIGYVAGTLSVTAAPPVVVSGPTNLTVTATSNASFAVTASGTVPLSYQWFFQTTNVLLNATNASVTLTNVNTSHAGGYTVVITNVAGSVTSSVAALTVNRLVPGLTWATPAPITYGTPLGASQLNASSPVAGALVYSKAAGTVLAADAHSLSVQFTPADTNVYQPRNASVILEVNQAPLTIAAVSTNRPFGQTNPVLTVSYAGFVNGEGAGELSTPPVLATTAVTNSLPGAYAITVAVEEGVAPNYEITLVPGTLAVTAVVPVITQSPTNVTVLAGSNATFTAAATGGPAPTWQWYFNGTNALAGATNAILTLTNCQPVLAGGYNVVAANVGGSATSAVAVLTVLVPPTITSAIVDFTVNEDAASVVTNLTTVFTDAETPLSLTYAVVANTNSGLVTATITSLTNLTLAFTANSNGTSRISVSATDPDGLSVTNTFTVAVTAINDPPTVALATNNLVVLENSGANSLAGFATFSPGPANESAQTLVAYTLSNNNSALFSVAPAISASGTLTFTPTYNAAGTATVTVVAQDNGGTASGGVNKCTNTFTLTVTAVNQPPSFSLGAAQGPWVVSTYAGNSPPGTNDGTGLAAKFLHPMGVSVDSAGNVYVADEDNYTIRKIAPGGVVTTLAGSPGLAGTADGTGSAARFGLPTSTAVDTAGNVYVADFNGATIRKITPDGVVTTLAGLAGSGGSANGTGSAARFGSPSGVAVDSAGNVYVADRGNNRIRKITPAGVVTTLAGSTAGSADGDAAAAKFSSPYGVAVDPAGNVYVADDGNNAIRKITPGGVVTTLAGLAGATGSADGFGAAARFSDPQGVALDSAGNIFVADRSNQTVRKITPGGMVTTIAGQAGANGTNDGPGTTARFSTIYSVAVDTAGNVYAADYGNHRIRKITPAGSAATGITVVDGAGPQTVTNFVTSISAGPTNESSQAISFVVSNNNNALFTVQPFIDDSSALTPGAVHFTSAPGTVGVATVTVVAQDNGGTANGGVDTSAAQTFTITVTPAPPTISASPTNLTVMVTSNAVFGVTASGAAPLGYQWFFNVTNALAGATNASLTVSNAQPANAGTYSVAVTSSEGVTIYAQAQLFVRPTNTAFLTSGMLAWWPADGNERDIVGGNDGLQTGGVSYAPGMVGTAFNFTNATNAVKMLATTQQSNFAQMTLEAWVYPTAHGHGSDPSFGLSVISKTEGSGYALRVYDGVLQADFRVTGGTFKFTNATLQLNTWSHIATTYDGTRVIGYLNGQAMGTNTASGTILASSTANSASTQLLIGNEAVGTALETGYYWRGMIDEPAIYGRALSSNEVATIFNAGAAGKSFPSGPVLLSQPANQTNVLGMASSFSVSAVGSQPLGYQWLFNGTGALSGATNAVLSLTNMQTSQTGTYAVIVTNAFGAVTSSVATLTVLVPPAMAASPTNLTVSATSNATFAVTVSGTAPLSYQWFFQTTNELLNATNASVTVSNVTTVQAGNYTVVVTNIAGSVTSSVAVLTVERLTPLLGWVVPNAIGYGTTLGAGQLNATSSVLGTLAYTPPAGTLLPAGNHALSAAFTPSNTTVYLTNGVVVTQVVNQAGLTITANDVSREYGQGNPALTVRYAGFVNGETNTVLTAQPVAATVANAASLPGNYPITVSGAAGTNYAIGYVAGTLSVTAAPPVVVSGPASRTNAALTDASFTVSASGTAPLGYQWFFQATNALPNATNASLTMTNVTTLHAGSYTVVVTNVAGSVTSSVAALTVNRLVPGLTWATPAPIMYGVPLGAGQLNALVGVAGSYAYNPSAGVLLNAGSHPLAVAFTPSDGSVYAPVTGVVSQVVSPAALTITAQNQARLFGQANPALSVIHSGFTNGETASVLLTPAVTSTAADINSPPGNYPITVGGASAANYSIAYVAGTLTVTADGPTITSPPLDGTVVAGGTASFSVVAAGTGPLTYQWFFNATNAVPDATNSVLSITNAQPVSAGTYRVVVTNVAGSVTSILATLSVLVPPSVTGQPASVTNNALTDAMFTVTATGTAPLSYQWLKGESPLAGATNSALTLNQVTTTHAGGYRVVVTNIAGSVTSSVAALTVNRLVPGLTWSTPGAISYGTVLGVLQLNASAGVLGSISYSPAAGTLLPAGNHVLSAAFTPTDATVYLGGSLTVTQVVNQAALTITANNVSREYGQGNPPLTVRYTGFVSGETNTVLTSQPVASTLATAVSLPGNYEITVSGAAGTNYAIGYVAGTLSVTAAPPVIVTGPASRTNAALTDASFTVSASGTVPLSYQWFFHTTNALPNATNASLTLTNVNTMHAGGYSVVITNVTGSVTSSVAQLTVARLAPVLGWATPTAVTYGTTLSGSQLTATSSVPGTLSYTPAAGTLLPAGSNLLSVAFTPTDATVYLGGSLTVTQVVSAAALTITANDVSREYGQANPALTVRYAGFVNGETNTVLTAQPVAATTATASSQPGNYAITVSGAAGTNYTIGYVAGTLSVTAAPPVVVSGPASRTNNALTDASFTVSASGTAPLGYQWYFNATNALPGATNASVTVSNVTTVQAGNYTVVVTNVVGSVTSSVAQLTVERLMPQLGWATPAAVTYGTVLGAGQLNATSSVPGTLAYTPPAGTLLPAGSHVLAATFTPSDATVYLTNGVVVTQVVNTAGLTITANDVSREYGQATPALTVRYTGFVNGETNTVLTAQPVPATAANAASLPGGYPITVGGAAGTNYAIAYAPGTLTVTAVVPVITASPTNVTVLAGSNATFTAAASGGPAPTFQWYINGTTALVGATNASVTLTNAQPVNAGDYTVVAANVGGSVTSAVAMLTVLVPPSIVAAPTNVTVAATGNAMFSVTATGTAPLSYQWFFNATNVLAGKTNAALTVSNVTIGQAGDYTVVVTNIAGSVTSSVAALTVLLPPSIITHPTNLIAVVGADVSLAVVAVGSQLNYQWFNGPALVPGATNSVLRFNPASLTNSGDYHVQVANAAGSTNSLPARLTVTPAHFTAPQRPAPGAIQSSGFPLQLFGEVGRSFRVQVSLDLRTWQDVTNFTSTGAAFDFVDANATNRSRGYYRVVSP